MSRQSVLLLVAAVFTAALALGHVLGSAAGRVAVVVVGSGCSELDALAADEDRHEVDDLEPDTTTFVRMKPAAPHQHALRRTRAPRTTR